MQEFEGNIVYCQSCGKANQSGAIFCNYCGAKITHQQIKLVQEQMQDSAAYQNTPSNDEVDKEFVLANLQDLNNLYFISRNFDENINLLIKKKSQLGVKPKLKKPVEPKKETDYSTLILGSVFFYGFLTIILLPLVPLWLFLFIRTIKAEKDDSEKKYLQELEEYNKATNKYQQELNASEAQYKKDVNIGIPNLNKAINDLEKERNDALKLIDECYDINIIPSKYRNIYAIRFIYDYMTTSNATLRDALFACDLDKIQAQLEKVIQNQGSMICKLAKIEANSEKQIQQQERMINHLKNIETNTYDTARATELSARYNRIIAHNTNVMAYCSAMTYIDNRDMDDFNYYSPQTIKDFGLERFAQYYEK